MIRRILFFIAIMPWLSATTFGQSVKVTRDFGNALSAWASNDADYSLENLEQLCSKKPKFIISDTIMSELAAKNNLVPTDSYFLQSYISCMQKEIDKGVTISFSNIQNIDEGQVNKSYEGYVYAACDIRMSGAMDIAESALFIITEDDRIAKIQNFETTIDKKTRRRKVNIDWSGLDIDEDYNGIGAMYNYSKNFAGGFSVTYNMPTLYMMFSADMGFASGKAPTYHTQEVNFTDLANYEIKKGSYTPKYYLTITPAYCTKYFAIGWGFGLVNMKGDIEAESQTLSANDAGVTSSISSVLTMTDEKNKFMMRPTIRGFIPCSEQFYISLSVSYNWVPSFSKLNEFSFGIGFNYLFESN